jgi:hypothetical protein
LRKSIAAAMLMLAASGAASAATFSGSWEVAGDALKDPGLVVAASPAGGDSFSFELGDGQSTSFSLFRLWTPEGSVGADDLAPRGLGVRFALSGGPSGTLTGSAQGHRLLGLQWGSVDWDAPLALTLGDGGILSVGLDDGAFNPGLGRLSGGERFGADLRATFSYAAPVPLPPAAGLALLGLAALGLLARRRAG